MPQLQRAPTREYLTAIMDATRWDGYQPRPGDIVVATYPKCGTTWTQRIVDLLIHQNAEPRPIMQNAPWLDATIFGPAEDILATLESQTHRRSIKSHLPFDSLPVYEDVKYIHVARDGRDACFSMHNHQLGFRPEARRSAQARSAADPRIRPLAEPPENPRDFYLGWIADAEADSEPEIGVELPFFEFETTYWRERRRPNLLLVHYNDLKADLLGEMKRISEFLEIETPPPRLAELAAAAGFDSMKAQGEALLPHLGSVFDRGHDRFLNKGTNGRWKDVLTPEDLARYDALARARFTPSLAAWIEKGRLAAGDPITAPD